MRTKTKKLFTILLLSLVFISVFSVNCLAYNPSIISLWGNGYNDGYILNEAGTECLCIKFNTVNSQGEPLSSYYAIDLQLLSNYPTKQALVSAYPDVFGNASWTDQRLYSRIDSYYSALGSRYQVGYNDGLAESDIAENTILTIFSAPTYILSTVFDFELFGINIYTLVCFLLTLTIVSFILRKVF